MRLLTRWMHDDAYRTTMTETRLQERERTRERKVGTISGDPTLFK